MGRCRDRRHGWSTAGGPRRINTDGGRRCFSGPQETTSASSRVCRSPGCGPERPRLHGHRTPSHEGPLCGACAGGAHPCGSPDRRVLGTASVLELQRRRHRPGSSTRPSGGDQALHSWITSAPPGRSWISFCAQYVPPLLLFCFPHVMMAKSRQCTCPLLFCLGACGNCRLLPLWAGVEPKGEGVATPPRENPLATPLPKEGGVQSLCQHPQWVRSGPCPGEGRTGLFMG